MITVDMWTEGPITKDTKRTPHMKAERPVFLSFLLICVRFCFFVLKKLKKTLLK